LSKIEISQGGPRLMAGLKTLKYFFSQELPARLAEIFGELKQLPEARIKEYIRTILKYFLGRERPISLEDVRTGVKTALPEKEGVLMQSFAEAWIQEGEQRGEQKGEQRGKQEEAAKLTLRQLHRRFGILEAELDERIRSLSTEQLENLSEALLDFTAKSELLAWLGNAKKPEL
ncbi:MAG: DUF4351 domain-containing protein, partial [Blastocatellia bacterium]